MEWVTHAGMYTVSPLVPGLTLMLIPGLSVLDSIVMFSEFFLPAHMLSWRILYAPRNPVTLS